jgi:DNA sulfur modification protein DndC
LKEVNPSYVVTGVRKAESSMRAKSIDKWSISEFIGDHVNMKESHTFNPLVNWTITDVWKYLEMEGLPWGSTLSVRSIYRDATGECGFTNPEGTEDKSVEVCGARHGCWLCPVVLKDRSTEKMSEKHAWMEPLTEWRLTQLKVYGAYNHSKKARKPINSYIKQHTKAGYNRKGKKMEIGQGSLTVEARKYLFDQLIETEKTLNRLRAWQGLEPLQLIQADEIDLIKQLWADDLENRPYLTGEKLPKEVIELIES